MIRLRQATIRPNEATRWPTIWPACARGMRQCAQAWPGQGECHDTIIVSWVRGATVVSRHSVARAAIWRPTPCNTAQERCDTHDRSVTRRAIGACVAIQSLYRDRGQRQRGYDTAVCRDTMRDTAGEAYDTARDAHETGARPATRPARSATRLTRPTTRQATSHDTAGHRPTTRSAWAQCAQAGSGCAPGAPNPILTQCTVLSHCFRTLFMNTVHEVLKKIYKIK